MALSRCRATRTPNGKIGGVSDLPDLVDDPASPGNKVKLDVDDEVFAHGFAILDVDDAEHSARVRYYQETQPAGPLYEENI